MPKARSRPQRAIQILKWVDANWVIGRPVQIHWVNRIIDEETGEELDGFTDRIGRGLVIVLSKNKVKTMRDVVETVIHEAVHAIQWPVKGRAERDRHHHPAAFYAQQGEILEAFDHDGGWLDSAEFSFKE